MKDEWGMHLSPYAYAGTRLEQAIGGALLEYLQPFVPCATCDGDGNLDNVSRDFCFTCHGTGTVKDQSVGPDEVGEASAAGLTKGKRFG